MTNSDRNNYLPSIDSNVIFFFLEPTLGLLHSYQPGIPHHCPLGNLVHFSVLDSTLLDPISSFLISSSESGL